MSVALRRAALDHRADEATHQTLSVISRGLTESRSVACCCCPCELPRCFPAFLPPSLALASPRPSVSADSPPCNLTRCLLHDLGGLALSRGKGCSQAPLAYHYLRAAGYADWESYVALRLDRRAWREAIQPLRTLTAGVAGGGWRGTLVRVRTEVATIRTSRSQIALLVRHKHAFNPGGMLTER